MQLGQVCEAAPPRPTRIDTPSSACDRGRDRCPPWIYVRSFASRVNVPIQKYGAPFFHWETGIAYFP